MKKISIKDVALKAGVSVTLVSYVLNGKLSDRIKPATADKIRAAAKELNYHPNTVAKSLKLQKTFSIGLIVADISNPFSSTIARIIEDEVYKYGYTLIIGSSDENEEKSQKLIDLFINRQVDGFIIAPAMNTEDQISELLDKKVPLVLIDRYFPSLKTNNVYVNNFKASYEAAQHLINAGRKSIGIMTYQTELFHLNERVRGFKKALKDNNLNIDIKDRIGYVRTNNINSDVEKAIDIFLTNNTMDGIFFTSNKLAVAGLQELTKRSVRIPDDISVVAFDETEAYDLFYAPVTYVKQPLADIGKKAVEILIKSINETDIVQEDSVFDAELIVRHSSILIEEKV